MNGLLLNEHRLFNQCAKQYAIQHKDRDYQVIRKSIHQFMEVSMFEISFSNRKKNTIFFSFHFRFVF